MAQRQQLRLSQLNLTQPVQQVQAASSPQIRQLAPTVPEGGQLAQAQLRAAMQDTRSIERFVSGFAGGVGALGQLAQNIQARQEKQGEEAALLGEPPPQQGLFNSSEIAGYHRVKAMEAGQDFVSSMIPRLQQEYSQMPLAAYRQALATATRQQALDLFGNDRTSRANFLMAVRPTLQALSKQKVERDQQEFIQDGIDSTFSVSANAVNNITQGTPAADGAQAFLNGRQQFLENSAQYGLSKKQAAQLYTQRTLEGLVSKGRDDIIEDLVLSKTSDGLRLVDTAQGRALYEARIRARNQRLQLDNLEIQERKQRHESITSTSQSNLRSVINYMQAAQQGSPLPQEPDLIKGLQTNRQRYDAALTMLNNAKRSAKNPDGLTELEYADQVKILQADFNNLTTSYASTTNYGVYVKAYNLGENLAIRDMYNIKSQVTEEDWKRIFNNRLSKGLSRQERTRAKAYNEGVTALTSTLVQNLQYGIAQSLVRIGQPSMRGVYIDTIAKFTELYNSAISEATRTDPDSLLSDSQIFQIQRRTIQQATEQINQLYQGFSPGGSAGRINTAIAPLAFKDQPNTNNQR